MRRTVMVGIPSSGRKAHPNVRMTLDNKLVSVAYFGTEQLEKVFSEAKLYKQNHGKWPWEDIPFRNRAKLGKAGSVY